MRVISRIDCCGKIGSIPVPDRFIAATWPGVARPIRSPNPKLGDLAFPCFTLAKKQKKAPAPIAAELAEAVRNGERCLRIIHGRGHGSESGPVLKQALPGWLAEHPHGRQVLGFCCARDIEGGTGVTLVLLRRRRRSG